MSNEVDLHFHTAMRETRYNYWNALLTLNSIFISVFAASSFLSSNFQYIVLIIILVSIYSCALIISNYVIAIEVYEHDILPLQAKKFFSVEQVNIITRNIEPRILAMNKFIVRSEKAIRVLFALQLVLVLILFTQNIIKR